MSFLASLPANLVKLAYAPIGIPPAVEKIRAGEFPMTYLPEPLTAQELRSKIGGATVIHATSDFPKTLIKAGKAGELRSKFTA